MTDEPLIFVVDDDADVRESICTLLTATGFKVRDYPSAKSLLSDRPEQGSCLIVDIRMSEMDGLELQEEIARRGIDLPIIVMTGHGDVSLAVRALKAGALDFIEKPFNDEAIILSIRKALEIGRRTRNKFAEAKAAQELLTLLTPRERHVLERLVAGRSNKVSAHELGISPRTIEIHRARIMDKMKARSLPELVRIALTAGEATGGHF